MHHVTTHWNFHNFYTKKRTEVEQQADRKHFAAMSGPFRAFCKTEDINQLRQGISLNP